LEAFHGRYRPSTRYPSMILFDMTDTTMGIHCFMSILVVFLAF
jgi:hypothetical protein